MATISAIQIGPRLEAQWAVSLNFHSDDSNDQDSAAPHKDTQTQENANDGQRPPAIVG